MFYFSRTVKFASEVQETTIADPSEMSYTSASSRQLPQVQHAQSEEDLQPIAESDPPW